MRRENEGKGRTVLLKDGCIDGWRKEAREASVEAGLWKDRGQSLINTSWRFLALQSPSIF